MTPSSALRVGGLVTTLVAALATTLAPSRAEARVDFHDVLAAPPVFFDVIESTLDEMLDELGLRDELVDMVVVGSFAYGTGRLEDDADPSDIDIVLYMRTVTTVPEAYLERYALFRDTATRYNLVLQQRLGSQLAIDIKPDTRDLEAHERDPDWVGYSILRRRLYNRPAHASRLVHGQFFEDVYYVFERAPYQAFVARVKTEGRTVELVREGDQIVYYDRAALERGEKVELLRSLHKRAGQTSTAD